MTTLKATLCIVVHHHILADEKPWAELGATSNAAYNVHVHPDMMVRDMCQLVLDLMKSNRTEFSKNARMVRYTKVHHEMDIKHALYKGQEIDLDTRASTFHEGDILNVQLQDVVTPDGPLHRCVLI